MKIVPVFVTLAAGLAQAGDEQRASGSPYVFGWPFIEAESMQPRGGTTAGADVSPSTEPSAEWLALKESGIGKKERDRRAILAMAGPYRVSFDFLETVGFRPEFEPARPYRSWGTEYIYVLADEPDFISLQHIMVMRFEHPDGSVSEPLVIKHWRQDWRYEDADLHVYAGNREWQRRRVDEPSVDGTWSQAVFQVDDSPRYEAVGEWRHTNDYSLWLSGTTWRPLPRREFSARDDYEVLIGTNRLTIQPSGWVQEEDNLKVALTGGERDDARTALAREAGINRYERIENHDWSAGDAYWKQTAPYWREVREAWTRIYRSREAFRLKKLVDGEPLFATMFDYVEQAAERDLDAASARAEIEAVLESYLGE